MIVTCSYFHSISVLYRLGKHLEHDSGQLCLSGDFAWFKPNQVGMGLIIATLLYS